jgi:hypothetical protein
MDKVQEKEFQDDFQCLVDELLKKNPQVKLVQKLMTKYDLPYSGDAITEMNTVIQYFNRTLKGSQVKRRPS